MQVKTSLRYLEDRWDGQVARSLDEPELLRYRSNLLGSDLRITNFGGGNTSSKIQQTDPLSAKKEEVLWIKGSGGDLGSIKLAGLATLYLEKLRGLEKVYRGAEFEDEILDMYPLCAFGKNTVVASIDTPLHGFWPFLHIDHVHPDWGIALAASANGHEKMEDFNRLFGHRLVWVPWQRPGFELAMMLRRAVQESPNCDGIVLGGHGLFTWGDTQQECYENTISIIDQLGQFVADHVERKGTALFGGPRHEALENRRDLALDIFPFLRGRVSSFRRLIGNFNDLPEVLRLVNSREAEQLAHLGTSCLDHFIGTKSGHCLFPGSRARVCRACVSRSIPRCRITARNMRPAYRKIRWTRSAHGVNRKHDSWQFRDPTCRPGRELHWRHRSCRQPCCGVGQRSGGTAHQAGK